MILFLPRLAVLLLAAALLLGASSVHAATVTSFAGGLLTVTSDADDAMVIGCTAGQVRLNGAEVSGPVACSAVSRVEVVGGPGSNQIDLSLMMPADFSSLASTTLTGGVGTDSVVGSFANDTIIWNPGDGSDTNDGGVGNDRVIVNGSDTANTFTVGTAGVAASFDLRFVGPFTIDIVRAEVLEINGRGGDDTINASGLPAGLIVLEITGGTGTDTVVGSAGDDRIIWNPGDGSDSNDGGPGVDRVIVNGSDTANTFTVGTAGAAAGFDLRFVGPFTIDIVRAEVLEINGRGGDDTINANALPAGVIALQITGGTGNDTITGSAGDDTNIWNNGDNTDTFDGGAGNDLQIVNGAGAGDIVTILAATGAPIPNSVLFRRTNLIPFDVTMGNTERLRVNGLGGDDVVDASSLSVGLIALELFGGAGNDTLTGSRGNDVMDGGEGNDTLIGGLGNDSIVGGPGDDIMIWNPGDATDTNDGGPGNDITRIVAAGVAERFDIAPLACADAQGDPCARLRRSLPTVFDVDFVRVERLELDAGGGLDTVITQPLPGVRQQLDGGSPVLAGPGVGFFPVDTLSVTGVSDPRTSPVAVAGFGEIQHANFEFAPVMITASLNGEAGATAELDGAQEVPPVNTSGSARGSVVLSADESRITVRLAFRDLSSAYTMSHIHGPAPRGSNAGVIFDLGAVGATPGEIGPRQFAVSPQQVADLKAGLWYFNIHTVNHPSGEVRGQIELDQVFRARLEPQQVVGDPVVSSASGAATILLAGSRDSVVIALDYRGLTGEGVPGVSTSVRLHGPARRGTNGPALLDFPLRVAGAASDLFVTQEYPITAAEVTDLEAGRWYFEVRSAEFPDGELRGQVDDVVFCDGFGASAGC